jgi:hypothetical protein
MAVLIVLAAVGLAAAGVSAGLVGMVSVAIRREEKNLTLTSVATGKVVRLGRWLNGAYVRVPRHIAAADRQTVLPRTGLAHRPRHRHRDSRGTGQGI